MLRVVLLLEFRPLGVQLVDLTRHLTELYQIECLPDLAEAALAEETLREGRRSRWRSSGDRGSGG
jgi:hypothetical protein